MRYRPQRLAFVANSAWSLQQFRLDTMLFLQQHGYEVHAIAPPDGWEQVLFRHGITFHPWLLSAYGYQPCREWSSYRQLKAMYRSLRPHLIFHYTLKPNTLGGWAAHRLGIPGIAVATGIGHAALRPPGLMRGMIHHLYRQISNTHREVWVLNAPDWHYLKEHQLGDLNKVRILPGEGVHLQHYPAAAYRRNRYSGAPCRFLYAGRLLRQKGIYELIGALRLLTKERKTWTCRLVGSPPLGHPDAVPLYRIEQWVREGLVTWSPEVADVRPWLQWADVVVLPSWREGLSRILLEAAASARPLLAARVPGCAELISNGRSGLLHEPRNAADLARKMRQFIRTDRTDRQAMGSAGRLWVSEHFGHQRILDAYQDAIYRQLRHFAHPKTQLYS